MSAAVFAEPPARHRPRRCPHVPPCPPTGPDARPIDGRPEHGWSLLCNGVILYSDGTWTAPLQRTPVRLSVWGLSEQDAELAYHAARHSPSGNLWHIVEVERAVAQHCPIRRHDPRALAQGADNGHAWAAYRVEEPPDPPT